MKHQTPSTQEKILQLIIQHRQLRAEDIRQHLKLSRTIIHRHLNRLIKAKKISKTGKPPLVFYLPYTPPLRSKLVQKLNSKLQKTIQDNYLYISPEGQMIYGLPGFLAWASKTSQANNFLKLAAEYHQTIRQASQHKNRRQIITAAAKIKNTFKTVCLKQTFYLDFYSLPKFGKTILGQKVLYAKQSQSRQLIADVSLQVSPFIKQIIKRYNIRAVAFIPPTIPRKIQFLKELEQNLNLNLPKIRLVKAYPTDLPVPQKSLSKLQDRIQNAKSTIFIKNQNFNYSNILLIDDAVGSGATLNETACKLKQISGVKKVYGFAIVGSYKGFDVISEI